MVRSPRTTLFVGLLLTISAVSALSASGAPAKSGATGEKTYPNVTGSITYMGVDGRVQDPILIQNFNRIYPNVHVTLASVPGANLDPALTTQLQAGSAPDVMTVFPGTGVPPSVKVLAQAGDIANLSSMPWAKRVPTLMAPLTEVKGHPYMWDTGASMALVMYNTDDFHTLGLTPPTTFSQLLDLCAVIQKKDPGKVPISIPAGAAGNIAPVVSAFASSSVYGSDPSWDSQRLAGKVTFANTPGWATAFNRFVQMQKAGCLSPGVTADNAASVVTQFATGQSVMMMFLTSFGPQVQAENPNIHFSYFPIPATTAANTYLTLAPGSGIAVNAHSANLVAAEDFVNFLARAKETTLWAGVGGFVSPWDFQKKLLPSQYAPLVPYADKTRPTGYLNWPTGTTFTLMGNSVDSILTGQMTIPQVLQAMDASWGH